MSTASTNKRAARIVGGLLIASSAALAVGLRAENDFNPNHAHPLAPTAAAAENEIEQLPHLKSIPPQSYPLTLANEPAQARAEVITAEHYETAAVAKRNHPPKRNRTPNPPHPPKLPRHNGTTTTSDQ